MQNEKLTKKIFGGIKLKAVELTYARCSISEICGVLDVPRSVLVRWRKENGFPGKGNPKPTYQQREIAELKKKPRDAEMERDILKKAIAIMS